MSIGDENRVGRLKNEWNNWRIPIRPGKDKECLLRQVSTKDLDTFRFDFGGCNSAAECLLPKQDVEGSNPFTRSTHFKFDTKVLSFYNHEMRSEEFSRLMCFF